MVRGWRGVLCSCKEKRVHRTRRCEQKGVVRCYLLLRVVTIHAPGWPVWGLFGDLLWNHFAPRGCSRCSRGFREKPMMGIITGRAPPSHEPNRFCHASILATASHSKHQSAPDQYGHQVEHGAQCVWGGGGAEQCGAQNGPK